MGDIRQGGGAPRRLAGPADKWASSGWRKAAMMMRGEVGDEGRPLPPMTPPGRRGAGRERADGAAVRCMGGRSRAAGTGGALLDLISALLSFIWRVEIIKLSNGLLKFETRR